jgi:hypothetical protein
MMECEENLKNLSFSTASLLEIDKDGRVQESIMPIE